MNPVLLLSEAVLTRHTEAQLLPDLSRYDFLFLKMKPKRKSFSF